VNQGTPVSLRYPLSVFNKNSTLNNGTTNTNSMSTKGNAVDLTGHSSKRARSEVGSGAMFMLINDSSEPTEVLHYMFLVPDKKDMDTYVHDRLVRLKSEKKWHFPYVKHDSFEGLVGPAHVVPPKMEIGDEADGGEEDNESTMTEVSYSFFKTHMKETYKWPRRGYGKVELANMDFIVNYTELYP